MRSHIFRSSFVPLLATLLLLLIAGAVAQAPLPPGPGDVRVTSSMRPELRLMPGEARIFQLTLENTGDAASSVRVSQLDFRLDESGDPVDQPPSSLPISNASWVQAASQVEVPAASTVTLPVTVRVPQGVAAGTYWSLLLVEPNGATTVDRGAPEQGVRTTVTVNFRFGVTVLTHVGQPQQHDLVFRDPELVEDDLPGGRSLGVTIENPAHFLASSEVWLELYDPQGNLVRRVDGGTLRIYPGAARRHTFDLGSLGEEAYQAVVIADAGGDAVFGVRYDLDLSGE